MTHSASSRFSILPGLGQGNARIMDAMPKPQIGTHTLSSWFGRSFRCWADRIKTYWQAKSPQSFLLIRLRKLQTSGNARQDCSLLTSTAAVQGFRVLAVRSGTVDESWFGVWNHPQLAKNVQVSLRPLIVGSRSHRPGNADWPCHALGSPSS